MNKINANKMGIAVGLTGSLFYLGCMLLMLIVGHSGTVAFFNALLHGLDVSSVTRMEVPILESIVGLLGTFVLSWIIGACIAAFYNVLTKPTK